MTLLATWRARQAARRDAALGINSLDHLVVALLGPRPVVDPANLRHAGQIAAMRPTLARRDWEDDLRAREDAYAGETSPTLLLVVLVAITAIEIVGGCRVMKAIGVVGKDQILFGCALGLGLLSLTLFVARQVRSFGGKPSSFAQRMTTACLGLVYAAVVAALAYSRAEEAGDQVGGLGLYAEIAIMVTATAFPAWLSEILYEKYVRARRMKRDIQRLRRDIRRDERRQRGGVSFAQRFGAASEAYDRAASEIRAAYTVEHRRVSARQPSPPEPIVALVERSEP